MTAYYAPTTHYRGPFRVTVTHQGAHAYRAAIVIGGGARHVADDVCATPARVAEVWDAPTPGDALAAADACVGELAEAGEYAAWMGGDPTPVCIHPSADGPIAPPVGGQRDRPAGGAADADGQPRRWKPWRPGPAEAHDMGARASGLLLSPPQGRGSRPADPVPMAGWTDR